MTFGIQSDDDNDANEVSERNKNFKVSKNANANKVSKKANPTKISNIPLKDEKKAQLLSILATCTKGLSKEDKFLFLNEHLLIEDLTILNKCSIDEINELIEKANLYLKMKNLVVTTDDIPFE